MTHFVARTIPSGDAMHYVSLFLLDDDGAWLIRRPQDYPRAAIPELVRLARAGELTTLFERARVRVADHRPDVPRAVPYTPPFNRWSANLPGTSYFLPVAELTAIGINVMLSAFDDEFGFYLLDDRNGYQPAGIARFATSKGGHLDDNIAHGRVATVGLIETWLCEFAAFEGGAMMQNLGLMAAALGLGGFPHFAAHPYGWCAALGFRMQDVSFARVAGVNPLLRGALSLLGRDTPLPTPVGLERGGEVLIKPFCPPYYPTMEAAVLAFIDYKYAAGRGTLRDGGAATAWRDGAAVQAGIPAYSDRAVAATIACCEYLYRRYGRFPVAPGPFRTLLAYQAHRLDPEFYARFYRPDDLDPF